MERTKTRLVLNLTQHISTREQVLAGVVEPEKKETIKDLLTFDTLPSKEEVNIRARKLADIAIQSGIMRIMIGGAPYLMNPLEGCLRENGMQPLHAFSQRTVQVDGNKKTVLFKHIGFVDC